MKTLTNQSSWIEDVQVEEGSLVPTWIVGKFQKRADAEVSFRDAIVYQEIALHGMVGRVEGDGIDNFVKIDLRQHRTMNSFFGFIYQKKYILIYTLWLPIFIMFSSIMINFVISVVSSQCLIIIFLYWIENFIATYMNGRFCHLKPEERQQRLVSSSSYPPPSW